MTNRLALQRCWNHSTREAIARCPDCGRSFCRECVVEHEDRVICSGCLTKVKAEVFKPKRRPLNLAPVWRVFASLVGAILAWFFFFSIGDILLSIPENWHDGTLWKDRMQSFIADD